MANRGDEGYGRGGRNVYRGGNRGRGGFNQAIPYRSGDPGSRGSQGGYRGGRGARVAPYSGNKIQPGLYRPDTVPTPDPSVTVAEDRLVKETRGKNFPLTLNNVKDVPMMVPGRRSYGTTGKPVILRTNYLSIGTKGDKKLYRYSITITDQQAPSKVFKRQIFRYILDRPELRNVIKATDYSSVLITAAKLDFLDADGEWSQKKQYLHPPSAGATPKPGSAFGFTIKFDRELSLHDTLRQLNAGASDGQSVHAQEITQALNIVLARQPNISPNVTVGTMNKFFPYSGELSDTYDLGAALQAVRGYYSSVRTAVGRMLLNVNATSGAFYKPQPLSALLRDIASSMSPDQQRSFIRGLHIEVRYPAKGKDGKDFTRVRTIFGLSEGTAASITFSQGDKTISVQRYYQQKHGITLNAPNDVCINVGTNIKGEHIPPEICSVLPGQQFRRFLSGAQTTAMLSFASRRPNANAHSIAGGGSTSADDPGAQGLRLLGLKALSNTVDPQTDTVHPFGFQVGTQLLTVPGRILQTPTVMYKNNSTVATTLGGWNYNQQVFVRSGSFSKTGFLLIRPESDSRGLDADLLRRLTALGQKVQQCGTHLGKPMGSSELQTPAWMSQNRDAIKQQLDEKFRGAKQAGIQLLIVVLSDADRWVYSQIKLIADTKHGVHTVCCIRNKLITDRGQGQFFGNLALKMNIKGGGVNHSVKGLFESPLNAEATMLVGIDVTHPSPGSAENAPSIACVVANTDPSLSQWPGSVRKRQPRIEIVNRADKSITKYDREIRLGSDITAMMEERLAVWKNNKANKELPDRIVIYRDGVSEGQYDLVLRHEWPEIQAAFGKFYAKGEEPKVSIIVVGKRHHTRFYPTSQASADKTFNPSPGTIVDRGIANKIMSEFWLQAHSGLQGSARPAHYVVIKDDIGFEADQLQNFTHKLCYMFTRATKAISICPPAYYADLLADRTRMYEYEALNENNGGKPYSPERAAWDGTIHNDVKDCTWYI